MAEEVQNQTAPSAEDRQKAVRAFHSAKTPEEKKQAIESHLHLKAIHAYHESKTPEEKRAAVKQYPWLAETFSEVNHS